LFQFQANARLALKFFIAKKQQANYNFCQNGQFWQW